MMQNTNGYTESLDDQKNVDDVVKAVRVSMYGIILAKNIYAF